MMEHINYEAVTVNTLVVGTGASGYNAALRLYDLGVTDVAILTEGQNVGTSRNTGSDKQTYYKLGLSGDTPDSVRAMAEDLFRGGCVDGDNALAEAACSARSFLHLCELGVPFPTNRYGEYVGYKTDHDPHARATSVGPLTSKEMTERLESAVLSRKIPIHDRRLAIELLTHNGRAVGLLALDVADAPRLVLYRAESIVFATGGPGGIYADSVYPACHNGASGVLFRTGASGQNLTYWQYGLASVAPRWNVSGTYMQVLPRFVSVDADGKEHEFLYDYFRDEGELLTAVFLKGYQWPFDSKKVLSGSSVIDLLVYRESVMKHRRVYLDFRQNPQNKPSVNYAALAPEARDYLEKADAAFGRPIDRLRHMNAPAIALYRDKGVDLETEMLEIALCAQHNNGGVKVDARWQSDISHLFVVGEAAGTHGISRPGGSALNAGQVGSLRAAEYIAYAKKDSPVSDEAFKIVAKTAIKAHASLLSSLLSRKDNVEAAIAVARRRMSENGGVLRHPDSIRKALDETEKAIAAFGDTVGASKESVADAYRLRDILCCQKVYLFAMLDHTRHFGNTNGSALYYDENGSLRDGLPEVFRFTPDDGKEKDTVQEVRLDPESGRLTATYRPVRPIPPKDDVFETVWRTYRETHNAE